MNKVIVITGLTGSGKSSLALYFARKYNGEIISADSVQVYKGLDIGSAKENIAVRSEIPHYLIDIKNFNETYNVNEFVTDCEKAIQIIINKGKLPIIVGGTGLYIKALMEGYTMGNSSADEAFRIKYQNMAIESGNEAVWEELNKLSPEMASKVHYNNLKRVIRYLEICKFGDMSFKQDSLLNKYNTLAVGLIENKSTIYPKLDSRVDEMLNMGLEYEINKLIDMGATRDCQSMNSIGYKEWFDYLDGKIDKTTTINLIKQHTRNYCKRQLTFLKTINNLKLMDKDTAKVLIEEFIKNN